MANWAVATSASPDFYRYAKNWKGVAAGAFGGMILGNGGTMVIGAILAAGVGNADLMVVMSKLGLYSIAIWFLIAGVWTSAQTNVYVSSLSLSNIFKVRRFWMAILCGLVGTIMGGLGLYTVFIQWLIVLGVIFPGIIGIFVADYWLINKGIYREGDFTNIQYKINVPAIIAWIIAVIAEYFLGKANMGVQFLNGFLIALVVYTLLSLVFVRKETTSKLSLSTPEAGG
jgi:cytosine permease